MRTKYNIGDTVYYMSEPEYDEDILVIRNFKIDRIHIYINDIEYADFRGNSYSEKQLGRTPEEVKKNMIKLLLESTQKEKKKIMSAFWREEV